MDQADKLRELASADSSRSNMISIISGKGGVGKSSLALYLYNNIDNALIIESDISSPYFRYLGENINYEMGYKTVSQAKYPTNIDKLKKAAGYKCLLVDGGTGINDINKYYIDRSKLTILVTDEQKISVLNTIALIKKLERKKVVFLRCEGKKAEEIRKKLEDYSQKYLINQKVKIFDSKENLLEHIASVFKK